MVAPLRCTVQEHMATAALPWMSTAPPLTPTFSTIVVLAAMTNASPATAIPPPASVAVLWDTELLSAATIAPGYNNTPIIAPW